MCLDSDWPALANAQAQLQAHLINAPASAGAIRTAIVSCSATLDSTLPCSSTRRPQRRQLDRQRAKSDAECIRSRRQHSELVPLRLVAKRPNAKEVGTRRYRVEAKLSRWRRGDSTVTGPSGKAILQCSV